MASEFRTREFLEIFQELEQLRSYAERIREIHDDVKASKNVPVTTAKGVRQETTHFRELLNKLAVHCESLGLKASRKYIDRMHQQLKVSPEDLGLGDTLIPVGLDGARNMISELRVWVLDELSDPIAVSIHSDFSRYYRDSELFGPEVYRNFGTAALDIEEAGKCLALGRSTACVFHLMRVMETGLRALGKSLNDRSLDPKRNPTWEAILHRCDDELKKPIKDRSPEWRSDDAFFSNATANLRAVKNAWRNPSAHVETFYDEQKAFEVWNAVNAFMRQLATKLQE